MHWFRLVVHSLRNICGAILVSCGCSNAPPQSPQQSGYYQEVLDDPKASKTKCLDDLHHLFHCAWLTRWQCCEDTEHLPLSSSRRLPVQFQWIYLPHMVKTHTWFSCVVVTIIIRMFCNRQSLLRTINWNSEPALPCHWTNETPFLEWFHMQAIVSATTLKKHARNRWHTRIQEWPSLERLPQFSWFWATCHNGMEWIAMNPMLDAQSSTHHGVSPFWNWSHWRLVRIANRCLD